MIDHPSVQASGNQGFSLLELLVVLVVMVSLVSIVVPEFSSVLEQLETRKETRKLAAIFLTTRNDAIFQGKEKSVIFDSREHKITVTGLAGPLHWSDSVRFQFDTSRQPRQDLRKVTFFPDGTSTGVLVDVVREPFRYSVEVDWLTGAVNVTQ